MSRAIDPVTNFAEVIPVGLYTAASASITLTSGDGGKLPDTVEGQFNLVWYNSTDYTGPASDPQREIIRVVTRTVDALVILRGQEGTVASNKNIAGKTYKMALGVTKRLIDEINTGLEASADLIVLLGPNGFPLQTGNAGEVLGTDGTNLSWVAGAGINSLTNVGAGVGQVGKNIVGPVLNLKTLQAGANVTIVNNADEIVISSTGGGGGSATEFQILAADPGAPTNGDVWYNSTTNLFKFQQNGVATILGSGSGSPAVQEDVTPFVGTVINVVTSIVALFTLYKNGVLQTVAGGDYTRAGQVVTLGSASLITDRFTMIIGVSLVGATGTVASSTVTNEGNTINSSTSTIINQAGSTTTYADTSIITNNSDTTNTASSTTVFADNSVITNNGDTTYGATATNVYAASSTTTFADESVISNQADETYGAGYEGVYQSGANTQFQSGSTTDFNAGAVVDFTGATVTGLATGGGTVTMPYKGSTNIGSPWYASSLASTTWGISTTSLVVKTFGGPLQSRTLSADVTNFGRVEGSALIGTSLYLFCIRTNPSVPQIAIYDTANIPAGPVIATFAGATVPVYSGPGTSMSTDGTTFYFTYNAGNSANSFAVAKYSLAGTTFTYVSTVTCGAITLNGFSNGQVYVAPSGDIYSFGVGSDNGQITRFNSVGTQVYQDSAGFGVSPRSLNLAGVALYNIGTDNPDLFLPAPI